MKQKKNENMVQHSQDISHNTDETPKTYGRGKHPNSLNALEKREAQGAGR